MQSWGSFEPVPNRLAVEPPSGSHGRPPPVYVEKAHPTEEEHRDIMWHKNHETMPKRLRLIEKGFRHMENQRMHKEDRLSDLRGALERKPVVEIVKEVVIQETVVVQEKIVAQEKIVKVYVEKDAAASDPRFLAGQSVHKWWAPWMAGAKVTPTGIKGKSRPAWFSCVVFAATALSPSMPRCRNDRNFTRHQLSRSGIPACLLTEMFQGDAARDMGDSRLRRQDRDRVELQSLLMERKN